MTVETSRPRAGRRFQPTHELALVPDAQRACGALPGAHQGLLVVSEMTGPYGIPDLTALVGDQGKLAARLDCKIPPLLHQVDAGVAAVAHPRAARSVEQLAQRVSWPAETVARRIGFLLRYGALSEVKPGRYVRHEALQPLGRLYAVEAKVRDWRKALRQVRTYSVWADSYVLAMGPLSEGVRDDVLAQVDADKAGLVVDGRWLRRPSTHRLSPAARLWAAEHLVAALRP